MGRQAIGREARHGSGKSGDSDRCELQDPREEIAFGTLRPHSDPPQNDRQARGRSRNEGIPVLRGDPCTGSNAARDSDHSITAMASISTSISSNASRSIPT
jgi:hypothetical protein